MNPTTLPKRLVLLGLTLAAPSALADAGACVVPQALAPDAAIIGERRDPDLPTNVKADQVLYDRDAQLYTFTGDVLFERADQNLRAQHVRYAQGSERVDLEGDISYRETGIWLGAREGFLYLDRTRGRFEDVEFALEPGTAHGAAEVATLRSETETELERVRYTVCPAGDEDWWIVAKEIEIDREASVGVARHARLEFFGVPLFYSPYLSFALDDTRKSGFLPPKISYADDDGLDVTVPYYLNLAPNYDATLYPRLISERGLLMGAEARLLRPRYAADTYLAYMPEDSLYGDPRWLASAEIESRLLGPLSFEARGIRVSDDDYVDDFSSGPVGTGTTHLASYAVASYRRTRWMLRAQARTWQTIDPAIAPANYPLQILPRIEYEFSSNPYGNGWDLGVDADWVNFGHPHPDLRDTGSRLDLTPRVSYRYEQLGYFLVPTLALQHTHYELERAQANAALPDSPSRTAPIFSLDSGLFLERELSLGGRGLLQTLEPRLFYVYIPERDQTELPLFDTSEGLLSMSRLFTTNRFTGPDRLGDANQIAFGITSRILDRQSGRQYAKLGIGQIYYFDEPEVQLNGQTATQTRKLSDLLANFSASFGHVSGSLDLRWDPYDGTTESAGARVSLQPGPGKLVNTGYRLTTGGTEQAELSFIWPVKQGLAVLGGWHYDLDEQVTVDRFAGLAYRNCCWAARLVAREWLDEILAPFEHNRAIMLQLEFSGLGATGEAVDEFLLDEISGYNVDRY